MNKSQLISSPFRLHNPTQEILDKIDNLTDSDKTYSFLNTQEEDTILSYHSTLKNVSAGYKISIIAGKSKNYIKKNTSSAVVKAFNWAMSDVKSQALNTSVIHDFDAYKRLTPHMGCLFTADKFADVLIKLVAATENKPTYKESYMLNIKGRENIAICLKRKDDNFTISFYDGNSDETGHHKYRFNFHGNLQTSIKTIAEDILTNITENPSCDPLDTNNCALYSLDTAKECFDISVFTDPENQGLLITSSRYAKVDPKYFHNTDGSEINILEIYDNTPQNYKNKLLSNLLLNNRSQEVSIITTKILEDNSQFQEQDKKHNLINISDLCIAFTKENTEAIVEFITTISKSNLTAKDKAEIFINYSTNNIGTTRSGILQAIQTGNNETAIEYIKAILDHSSNIFEIINAINNLITSPSLLRYAINCNNSSVFSFYIKYILANTEVIDGNKVLLLLDKDKDNKCTLDTLIANKKYDMAVSYLTEVLNDTTLDNQLKLILLTTDKLNYDCRESLANIASDRNQIDAIFENVKSVLARTDISASQKIAKLQAKPAPKFWQKLLS
jgi:hypothetical protein